MNCKFCEAKCQKAGRQKNGQQKLYCKACKKYQQGHYRYKAYKPEIIALIPKQKCESVGIRGAARILKIANNTVLKHIKRIANSIPKPPIPLNQQEFEVDELRTFVGHKGNEYWVAYALNRSTGEVVDYIVGKRSKRTLSMIINTLLLSEVKRIYTDNLTTYKSLIPKSIHSAGATLINHIERRNLNLRTHLKRLSRKTICFSRTKAMLDACLRIYFWGSGINYPSAISTASQ
ncbi:MAG: IS1 family transposase [Sphingobacteriales bacterium]|nr:IS1 family transposase [Sphingobacteriales bacterium]OJV97968.1 MAG: hypothetical protein BGO52_11005 [Sphingobacteriales bacterium 44-61]